MREIIMLCGQGGIGKSTYGKKLIKINDKAILIRMDDIVLNNNYKLKEVEYLNIFLKNIQNAIDD